MKKFYVIVLAVLVAACGDDDGGSDPFDGIPSGEIVSVEERDFVLTGTDATARVEQTNKWWEQDVSKIEISGPEDCGESQDISQENTYYAFTSSGDIRVRTGTEGDGFVGGSWEWTSSSKDAIFLNGETSVEFVIRALNSSEVIYASQQAAGSCSAVTWERFVQ